jgi:hypothetical protein
MMKIKSFPKVIIKHNLVLLISSTAILLSIIVIDHFVISRTNLNVTSIKENNNYIIEEAENVETSDKPMVEEETEYKRIITNINSKTNNETDSTDLIKDQNQEPNPEPEPTLPTPPQPQSCPQATLGCVPCQPGEAYCRYETGEVSGYLGWACQNNNLSNIRYSDYRINIITRMGGSAPCGEKGGYMTFSNYETGRNSVKAYIRGINAGLHSAYNTTEFTCGDCTLLQFFSKYAPNNPVSYTNGITEKMNQEVTNDTKLNWIVTNRLDDFIDAIECMEGYFTLDGRRCKYW